MRDPAVINRIPMTMAIVIGSRIMISARMGASPGLIKNTSEAVAAVVASMARK